MESWPRRHRITVDEYYRMAEVGLLAPDARVELDEYSMPEPDLAVFKWRDDFYRHGHPAPADTLLAVEVSDRTLRYDRDVKASLYARHGIPEYWIVDLQHNELRIHRQPRDDRYAEQLVLQEPGVVAPAALPDVGIDFAEIFAD